MRILITAQYIHQGGRIPRFYGLAYWKQDVRVGVFWIMPFNLIARLWQTVISWIRMPGFTELEDVKYQLSEIEYYKKKADEFREIALMKTQKAGAWDALCRKLNKPNPFEDKSDVRTETNQQA